MANNRFIKVDGSFERVVEPGDTLSGIAAERGIDMSTLLSYNPQYKANPNLIRPGERVLLGTASGTPGTSLPPVAPSATPTPTATPTVAGASATPTPSPYQDPMDNFNMLMTGLLKNAQGVNTADYLKRKRALDRAVVGKTSEITPEELRTLSPEQQNTIRSGNVSALKPDIDENAYQLEKAQQSIDNFFKVFGEAQKIGSEFADKLVAPESVITNAKLVIEADPDRMGTVLAGFNDKSKQKIIESLDYSKLHKAATTEDEGGKLLTPSEAAQLGVPYGTTRSQAAGKTPRKPVSATQSTDLVQGQIAFNNVKRIAELIEDIGITDPIIGRFRKLNPYDTKVVELTNLITQTVPGLARGIFKEVGVLTDTDINRYTQTLANPTLTKEQAKNATEQLLKTIKFSLKTQLDTFDKTGKDVTQFDDLLNEVGGGEADAADPLGLFQ